MIYCKSYVLSVFVLLSACLQTFPQQPTIDSLRTLFNHSQNDSLRGELLYQIGVAQESIDYKISRKVFDTVAALAQEARYTLLEAQSYLETGGLGFDHGDYALAIKYYNKAGEKYNLLKGERRIYGLAAVYNNLGGILSLVNDWESAQKYYFKALKEYDKLGDSTKMMTVYFNLAFVYSDMNEWNKSFEQMYRSFELIRGSKNKSQNLTTCSRLATICFKTERAKEGLYYLQKSDSLLNYSKGNLELAYYHHAYGEYYHYKKDFIDAIRHHKLAYGYAIKWDDPYYLADESIEIGKDYLEMKQFDSADLYFQISYREAASYNYKPKVLLALGYLSSFEDSKGNFKKAYDYKKRQAAYADTLVKEQNHYRILLMDEEFGAEKRSNEIVQLQKDKQIQVLSLNQKTLSIKQKSTLNYFLISALALLLLVGFVGFRNLRHRQLLAKQKDELQQQRIRELEKDKQLVAVDSMLKGQQEERARLAKDLHDGLGGMLSGVKFSLMNMKSSLIINHESVIQFERSLDMLDTSIQELRRVAHNMMPETLIKFGLDEALKDYCDNINKSQIVQVQYQSFGMHQRLDSSIEIIVYRIVQELFANIFKHAKATEVLVQLVREDSRLSLAVEDNGKGFDTKEIETGKGAGWANIRSRVDYLKGKLDLHSEAGNGTSVNIELNV
jgi:two-component system, NarL family, sensor kinase